MVNGIERGEVAATITSMITEATVEELKLKVGDNVEAVIKASEVMVSKE